MHVAKPKGEEPGARAVGRRRHARLSHEFGRLSTVLIFICFRCIIKKVLKKCLFSSTVNIILRRASYQPQFTNKDLLLTKSDPSHLFAPHCEVAIHL
jgi:hypothetical protein